MLMSTILPARMRMAFSIFIMTTSFSALTVPQDHKKLKSLEKSLAFIIFLKGIPILDA